MSKTVLCIEDEEDYQILLKRILGRLRLHLETAATAEEGWRQFWKRKPDLLILDVNLPDGNGYDFCRRLRDIPSGAAVPVLLLTVRRRPEEWLKGFSAGADDYLLKPFNPPELIERVQAALNRPQTDGERIVGFDSEHRLIQAAVEGNRRAFEVLIEKYKPRLMRHLNARGQSQVDIDDLTAAAFAKAYARLVQFRGEASFYTWLFRIALNERLNRSPRTLPGEDVVCDRETPAKVLDGALQRQQLNRAFSQIPKKYQTILRWHFIRGYSYRRISSRLSIPVGTVMSRLSTARELLRRSWTKSE